MSIAQKTLRSVRVIHAAFLLAALLYVWLPAMIVHASGKEAPTAMVLAVSMVALSSLGIAVFLRRRMVRPAADRLSKNPEDVQAAGRWRSSVVVSLAFCESLVLYGLALWFIGAGWNVYGVFYAMGIFLLLAWYPRMDLLPQ
jgi:F0F1-type ATP synthase membrane subunit c/vacuolar-type H+-ATPase subunit K